MSELRKDFILGRWVIVAVERAKRPNDFGSGEFLSPCRSFDFNHNQRGDFNKRQKIGLHQVLNHDLEIFASGQKPELYPLLSEYRQRILKIKQNQPAIKYVTVFKNYKLRANVKSFQHNHSNLVGFSFYPKNAEKEFKSLFGYYQENKKCFYCSLIDQELRLKKRVILENESFIVISPFASRFPLESWILPKEHLSDYFRIDNSQLKDLALIFGDILLRNQHLLGDFPYTYILKSGPLDTGSNNEPSSAYHWHIEIIPRLTSIAGFEWGTGCYINPTSPELAAEYLQKNNFSQPKAKNKGNSMDCPFCPGNEQMTPPEVDADRDSGSGADTSGWQTRTVPNKFPALKVEPKKDYMEETIFQRQAGLGSHEVIIETPDHRRQLVDLSQEEFEKVLRVYRRRFIFLSKDRRFKYILIFKNHGISAGASLEHPHTQLICLPLVPKVISEELEFTQKYFYQNKQCIFCAAIEREQNDSPRLVSENSDFLAFCPLDSRFPFEIKVIPKEHSSDFSRISNRQIEKFSSILKDLLIKLKRSFSDISYNFWIHSHPVNTAEDNKDSYHWYLELLPKLGEITGFELATGSYLNPVLPEEAASYLNKIEE